MRGASFDVSMAGFIARVLRIEEASTLVPVLIVLEGCFMSCLRASDFSSEFMKCLLSHVHVSSALHSHKSIDAQHQAS